MILELDDGVDVEYEVGERVVEGVVVENLARRVLVVVAILDEDKAVTCCFHSLEVTIQMACKRIVHVGAMSEYGGKRRDVRECWNKFSFRGEFRGDVDGSSGARARIFETAHAPFNGCGERDELVCGKVRQRLEKGEEKGSKRCG